MKRIGYLIIAGIVFVFCIFMVVSIGMVNNSTNFHNPANFLYGTWSCSLANVPASNTITFQKDNRFIEGGMLVGILGHTGTWTYNEESSTITCIPDAGFGEMPTVFSKVNDGQLRAETPLGSLDYIKQGVVAEAETTADESDDTKTPESKSDYVENCLGLQMVYVQGGTFMMGATSEQGSDADDDEKPVHKVTLSSYHISKYEITQAQWKAVMGENPSYFKGDNLPVENITWYEAKEFCDKLSEKTGKKYALPTEAQWEFAARGGVKSKGYKYSGSNDLGTVSWYYENSIDHYGDHSTHAVGTKAPNELGIYDMSGNVWEWCASRYGSYSSDAITDPAGPNSGSIRVIRGGGWCSDGGSVNGCRVSSRYEQGQAEQDLARKCLGKIFYTI